MVPIEYYGIYLLSALIKEDLKIIAKMVPILNIMGLHTIRCYFKSFLM